jgi:putative membrane protein
LAQSLATGKAFIAKIAEINLAEIELGRLAEQNASNLAIKDFAQRMIQDHTQAETTCSNWQTARGHAANATRVRRS